MTTPHQIASSIRSLVTSGDPEDFELARTLFVEACQYLRETADNGVSSRGEHYSWQLTRERTIQCLAYGMAVSMVGDDEYERAYARSAWDHTNWDEEWQAACHRDRRPA